MHKLDKIFQIKKKDIISITGTGGKTTLMFSLAKNLSKEGSVLITTSTKIALPKAGFDKLYLSIGEYSKPKANEIVCLGNLIEEKQKLSSFPYEELKDIVDDFDFVLIEADGSRNLPLKFWKNHEPVIYDFTNKVIGVLSIKVYDKVPNKDIIYNYEGFVRNLGDDRISYKTFINLIKYNKGLFKCFDKEKYIFINQVETDNDLNNVRKILENIEFDGKICYGSLKEGIFYED